MTITNLTYRKKEPFALRSADLGFEYVFPNKGKIILDKWCLQLLDAADGRTLEQIIKLNEVDPPDVIRAGLMCLAEAGLLERWQYEQRKTRVDTAPSLPSRGELVSVIVVVYEGKKWLEKLLPSIYEQTYEPIEIILVDNASPTENIESWLRKEYPLVKLVRLEKTISFSAANNLGVMYSNGAYILFLNQDTYLKQDAIANAVAVVKSHKAAAAIAFMLRLWWAPNFINGIGNIVRDHSWGEDIGFGNLDLDQFSHWESIPSACFAAVLIPRSVWEIVGPLDEKFPMYYEDAEWCYRARLLGYDVISAPKAIVYHAFGGKEPVFESELSPRKLRNACYGRLRFAAKLVGSRNLWRYLRNYLKEDVIEFASALMALNISKCQSYLVAWTSFLLSVPEIIISRKWVRLHRTASDEKVFFSFSNEMPKTQVNNIPLLTKKIIADYYLQLVKEGRTRSMPEFEHPYPKTTVLIVSNDIVDTNMAGPGMRYLEMARALFDNDIDVTLAIPNQTSISADNVRLITYNEAKTENLKVLVENHDYALISGHMVKKFPFLSTTSTRLIVDLYDPIFLENLYYHLDLPIEQQDEANRETIDVINSLAKVGDYFICGNERQRDLWLGVLAANGRINPYTFLDDNSLRKLIDVVGIGLPDRIPQEKPYLRNIHPRFDNESKIVLWGGGIWNWLDPITLIQAWPTVLSEISQARLVFLGTKHPNPLVPEHEMAQKAIALAKEIHELDNTIFFIEWVPYEEREALLTEANVGVTLHSSSLETRYSIRSRVIDYFWCRLPVLITDGDVTSEWVERYNVGKVVPPNDTRAVSNALIELLSSPKDIWREGFERISMQMRWSQQIQPLREFCKRGVYAPDRNNRYYQSKDKVMILVAEPESRIKEAMFIFATQGLDALVQKVAFHLRWLLSTRFK
jgi:GT2 family glycosyltransferase